MRAPGRSVELSAEEAELGAAPLGHSALPRPDVPCAEEVAGAQFFLPPAVVPLCAVRGLCLLTAKPMVYAANVAEDDLASPEDNKYVQVSAASSC